ncbi:bifunctional glutamate N-acetyltransferase/amino-acid acetyltransferase ArgJ [Roseospirillum parvum]|uniref:Arginine biosynthesis bifunctional protein ArgJ n=1 Tax=Roseospirillum parvum TaxID=83401 RepID=A0A1G7TWW2_9PROT|nr:bifunctional glutamate N-acetyltransferase/amino-acid acetyltransferase ArgJ [Roseospirillum parvum]SDG39742.1 glutamate N-acetyltransferase / amino-acid N-acetyltransferase [Roseospirillum parvum]
MSLKPSPLAPAGFPDLPPVAGARLAVAAAGVRYQGRDDVLLAAFDPGTTAAGVFTRSKTAAAPVLWCRRALAEGAGAARGLLVNAGNANAFTGAAGEAAVTTCVEAVAKVLDCAPQAVHVASTGTIGEPLPAPRIVAAVEGLAGRLGSADYRAAATAIGTTDTFPKGATRTCAIDGVPVRINGIAKGSGMIAPDMATMLAYVVTDAALPAPVLEALLKRGVATSFNAITVDSDTSTSDSLMLFATGAAGNAPVEDPRDRRLKGFRAALDDLLKDLAHQVVRDGEGATKFVEIRVRGATSQGAAKAIGLAIANSPLVKTAIAGADANWGRIVMAVGKSGQRVERDRLKIAIGGHLITDNGAPVAGYDEAPVAAHMQGQEIRIEVDCGLGRGAFTVWTCDLTHGYIDINADYRT